MRATRPARRWGTSSPVLLAELAAVTRATIIIRHAWSIPGVSQLNAQAVEALIEKLKAVPPEQRAEVGDFVDFLSVRAKKRAALDRLLAIAPAVEAAGIAPMSMEEINAEVKAARAERRARSQAAPDKSSGGQ